MGKLAGIPQRKGKRGAAGVEKASGCSYLEPLYESLCHSKETVDHIGPGGTGGLFIFGSVTTNG